MSGDIFNETIGSPRFSMKIMYWPDAFIVHQEYKTTIRKIY